MGFAAGDSRLGDRDSECQRSDLHQVAVFELARFGQRLAIHQGAVAATQITNHDGIGFNGEFGVLATDLFADWPKVAGLATTDLEFGPTKGITFPSGLPRTTTS